MNLGPADWCGARLSGGRYHVTDKLGEGGMGYVYKAEDTQRDCPVVIKVPNATVLQKEEYRKRFEREYLTLRNLSHPNIVRIYEARQAKQFDNIPYAVMEYMPGGDLCGRLSCDPRSLHEWLADVAIAIDYVHQRSHIHRDVKPGNILFDNGGKPHLSDFGIAKLTGEFQHQHTELTNQGFMPGTPDYMAPEMHDGVIIDGRVDQYALAVIVYEALAREKPYKGKTPVAVAFAHKTEVPKPITDVSESIGQAVMRGLSKDPRHRFKTCLDFAHAVLSSIPDDRTQPARLREAQSDREMLLIAEKIRAVLQAVEKYLTPATCEQIFGSGLASFYEVIDLRSLVCVCLAADVIRIVADAVYADEIISDDEVRFVYPLLQVLAKELSKIHAQYDQFYELQIHQARELLNFYKHDSELFGYGCVKTRSIGMQICCNVRQHFGDDSPSLLYDTMLYDLTSSVLRVDGITEEEKAYLNKIESEIVQRLNRNNG